MIIHLEYGERNSVIEFSKENHDKIKAFAAEQDSKYGFILSQRYTSANSYDCDDYLFIVWILNQIVESYNRMNFIPQTSRWREGYKEVPYIHVELYEGNNLDLVDGILTPNDKKLEIRVNGPNSSGCYTLWLDRYYLLRYIQFLHQIFDDNQELFTDISCGVTCNNGEYIPAENVFDSVTGVSKDTLLLYALRLKAQGANDPGTALFNYAITLPEDAVVSPPGIAIINNEFQGLIFPDSHRNGFTIPLKKQIFNTSGFARYFEKRNDLISEVFIESFLAIIAHEFSHVANGHCLLGGKDPDYANQKHIRICAEQNADDTAVRLRLSEPLFHGIDGNPHNQHLEYSSDELIHMWALRGFSMHLGLSWMYRGTDRIWNSDTLKNYLQDRKVQHPLYQFRTYNTIQRMTNFLSGLPDFTSSNQLITVDNKPVDHQMVNAAIYQAWDMINSFEACFEISYGEDERSLKELLRESWQVETKTLPTETNKVPYLMPVFNQATMNEVNMIYDTWPELKQRLEENGTYSMLYTSI